MAMGRDLTLRSRALDQRAIMRERDDQIARRALLAEIEHHRREHPQILAYFIARAIDSAGLDGSATIEDLHDAGLRTIVEVSRDYLAGAQLGVAPPPICRRAIGGRQSSSPDCSRSSLRGRPQRSPGPG